MASCHQGQGFPAASSSAAAAPPGMSLEGGAWRGRCGEARPGCWLRHTPRRHSSESPPALGRRFARGARGGQGKVLPSCRHFWELQLGHRRFLAPRICKARAAQGAGPGGHPNSPISGSHRPQGLFPHTTLGGKENGKKRKKPSPPAREKQLSILHDRSVPIKTTTRSQTPPVPTAQPHKSTRATQAGRDQRHGHPPPRPSLRMYTGHSQSKGRAPQAPTRKKGEKTNLSRRAIPGIRHAHTWAWIPRKPSGLNSTEAPQRSPRCCSQESRHRCPSPPTDGRVKHTWSP